MLRFEASLFAVVGVIASAIPIVIHLLNRRRFKTVPWAAMDFLHDAQQRQRKTLRIRDALLLASRMLALMLIGLVLSKPYFQTMKTFWWTVSTGLAALFTMGFSIAWATRQKKGGRGVAIGLGLGLLTTICLLVVNVSHSAAIPSFAPNPQNPVHAVLVVDNSRSLGVISQGGTLLDRAKAKATEFLDRLPLDSRITVIPLAGSETAVTMDAYRSKDDARRALDHIQLVDAAGSILTGLELAEQACQQMVDLTTNRVVLLTDLQANAWSGVTGEWTRRLPGLQVVNVAQGEPRNVWVTGLHAEEGLAGGETPCRMLARVHSSAREPDVSSSSDRQTFAVQARLVIDGTSVSSQTITMTSGQEREIEFSYQFEQRADPLQSSSAVAEVVIQSSAASTDQLPNDNTQQTVVPIVSSLTIVFIDQYGDAEDLEQNRIGETYALRHLMAPRSSTDQDSRRIIQVEHLRAEQLTAERLQAARLVVMAGIEKPDEACVALLRDFTRQGGPLVILAGGRFDPAAWTERAWLAGRGILPAPLAPNSLGQMPEDAPQQVRPFFAAFSSMQHSFFQVEGEDQKSLTSLFELTPFFKAVQLDISATVLEELLHQETRRYAAEASFIEEYDKEHTNPLDSTKSTRSPNEAEVKYRQLEPTWWLWRSPLPLVDRSIDPAELARRSQPHILARFEGNQLPFVVERRMEAGRVVFFTSGVTSNWNLLRSSGAMYLFHRTFSQLIEQTFPRRNFSAGESVVLPVERRQNTRYIVARPSGLTEPLQVDSISPTVFGLTLRRPVQAGTYVVSAEQIDTSVTAGNPNRFEPVTFAVNGAESESNLTPISKEELFTKLGTDGSFLLTADESIPFGISSRGDEKLWKRCGWCLLVCLLLEQVILVAPLVTGKVRHRWRI